MAEKSGFFNAIKSGLTYDRSYDASDFAAYFSKFIKNGVFVNPANQLKVVAKSGLTVTVKAGSAFINGYWYILDEDKDIVLSPNPSAYAVNSVIACGLDTSSRSITCYAKNAVSSILPDNSENKVELILASISLGVGVSSITNSNIVDRRPYDEYCGYVTGAVQQIDMTDLFLQFDTQFNEWFSRIKDQLTSDQAGNLQNQIDQANSEIDKIQSDLSQYKVLTKQFNISGGSYDGISLSYPSGFTSDNCYVKSFAVKCNSKSSGSWSVGTWYHGALAGNFIDLGCSLSKEDIYVNIATSYGDSLGSGSFTVRVILEKLPS